MKFVVQKVACVAGGVVSARQIKFWRRSRQASGEAARRMGGETSLLASGGGEPPKLRARALTIPPAERDSLKIMEIGLFVAVNQSARHGLTADGENKRRVLGGRVLRGILFSDDSEC